MLPIDLVHSADPDARRTRTACVVQCVEGPSSPLPFEACARELGSMGFRAIAMVCPLHGGLAEAVADLLAMRPDVLYVGSNAEVFALCAAQAAEAGVECRAWLRGGVGG